MSNAEQGIKNIVIVGGGTAGWMTAAALGNVFRGTDMQIDLIESEEIGTVGVGEATIPEILKYNAMLGINEADFLRATKATFKLGIEFIGWKNGQDRYFHPFGVYGMDMEGISFHHFWLKARADGQDIPLADFCLAWQAGVNGRFAHPAGPPNAPLATLGYAYHFDAVLYARFLRQYAEGHGVKRHEGKVVEVKQGGDTGNIAAVRLQDGRELSGDLFIDCTGFFGLLIEKTLEAGYDDWSHWLPCNSAVAVPSERDPANRALRPYTTSTTRKAGWQWNIPLQHRTGNGYVYSNQHISDDEAADTLLSNLDGKPLADVRQLRFTTGKRKQIWKNNCIAIGLSAGFLEPLESTSIHLIQSAITKLINLFPNSINDSVSRSIFNRLIDQEFSTIRNFLILHYNATERSGMSFWDHVRTMDVPDFLKDKRELFEHSGRVNREDNEIFTEPSWLAVFTGQGVMPRQYHPIANVLGAEENLARLQAIKGAIAQTANAMPKHEDYVGRMIGA
ncbi:tryptophan halogenase family protein [Sphingorhabdus arenilitoris]|uniref:Tryptophan halogenase family protein n=1 Tax=Sphingorhabdus arenilitoris TaxID=1490041 RepID=A0ABV8RK02_9SPHN